MKKRWFILLFLITIPILTAWSLNVLPAFTDIEPPKMSTDQTTVVSRQSPTENDSQSVVTETTAESTATLELKTEQTTFVAVEIAATIAETVTQSTTEQTTVYEEPIDTFGTAGRLDIPSVGVGVALYETDLYQPNVQSVVDAWDSAAVFPYRDKVTVIADHNYQGFDGTRNVVVGNAAFISRQGGSFDTYVCTRICYDGHNLGAELVDEYGEQVENNTDGELIMYTCNDCWQNITITYWQRTD